MRTPLIAILLLLPLAAQASGFYMPWYAEAFFWLLLNPLAIVAIIGALAIGVVWYIKKRKK